MIFRNSSFKSHVPRPLETVSRPFGWLACALLLVTTVTAAEAPTWWQTRGVLQTNATPNDYAALNVGQLKQIAFSAWQELESLPGGAGFQPSFTNAANNYAAVNVGQLKEVAQPCYNRLIGLGLATNYPWTNCQATNNYAIANIGLAKKLFSFFLDHTSDTDGDGMPNIWESLYGFDWSIWQTDNIHGPGDDADSDGLVNTQELAYATSPISMDTDNDRLTDLQEVRAGTNPRNPDTDQDGLSDLTELRSNQVMAWGTNDYGQCTVPDSVTNVIAVAGGSSFSLALRSDRTITNWGQNINIPSSATNVAAIAGGYMHGLALRRDGKVISWGYNNYGQTNVPVTLPAAVAIAAGSLHSVALCSDGRVIAWGDNTYGQRNVPARATPSIGLAAGLFHNLALRADGTVVAWGGTGFLNHGQTNVPASAINVVAIAGGGYHSLALLKDGTVVAWGDNTYGQCSVPASATDVVAIAAGQFHSFALCRTGKVVAWGDNDGGECAGASNVISGASIASGWHHGLVIPYRTDPLKWDTDNDTIPDGWEVSHGLDPRNSADASQDTDNDGLINSEEYLNNTNPYNVDTDGDGYSDSWEVENGFNPTDQSDIDADTDGDGLTNINEFFLGTNRTAFDTDNDGLSDGIESTPMYLTLWDENGDTGKLYPNLQVAQVTASDTARAARLKDGQVIIFTGSCTNMLAYTNDCGAAKIDATESWIAAVLTNGNVKVWREVNGALTEFSLGSTNAVDISGGFQHLLVLYKNGSVTCLNKDGSGAPVAYANLFCLSVNTNALSISVGGNADAVILKNRTTALLGSVYDTAFEPAITTLSNGLAVAVSAGINHNFVVQFANGSARAYLPIAYGTIYGIYYRYKEVLIPSGVVSIAAGGSSNMVAVLSNGSNAVFKYGGTNWNTATLTNQLTDAKDLWWRRGCNLAVTGAGELLPLAASSTSGRQLAYRMAAMTPGGAGRGIAAACLGTSATKNDSDGDNLSDGWEFYGGINPLNATGVDGQLGDPDGDGLSNFDEYINGTSPTKKDTDGDGVSDKVEVEQGSNPLDKSDNGIPPPASELVEIPFTVGDPSGSHSERWQMNIKSLGPTDTRAFYFVNETFGTVGTKNFKLRKGNSYEITLQHQATASGNTTDFDWQAQIGGLPSTSVLEGGKVHPTATRFSSRSDLNILIDNEDGLLGVVDQNFETPNHTISKIATLYVVGLDVYPLIHKDLGLVDASAPWYIGVDKVPSPVEELPESKRNIRASDLIIDTKISLPSHYGNITIQATGSAAYVYLYKAYFTPGENPFELILTPENRTATITLFDWFRVFCGRGSMSTDAHIICTNAGVGSIKINYNSTYQQSTPLQVEDEQMFTAVRLGLVPDYDRDGSISETDRTNAVNNRAFRFWVNNDKDIDAREGDDTPGATEPDCADAKVNGLRDLNDWMPLMIDASEVIGTIGMKKYSYWICHEDAAVNILLRPDGTPFSYPDGAHSCNSHIFDPDTAKYLVGGRVAQVTANGIEVTSQISEAINGKATVLLEGRGLTRGSDNCLTLEIRSKTDGSIAYKYRFMLSLDTVTGMYRQLNTRGLCGGSGGMDTRLGEPPNLPDYETSKKHIVYLHGYNINGGAAIAEQSAVFKNLWWCGSNARFHGVSWHGDATQIPNSGVTVNFYTNTANAFATAPHVANYIKGFGGECTIMAHSLGNMVASAAINLHKAPAANYFMLDAAVAQEAYLPRDSSIRISGMINANWDSFTSTGYPNKLFASEWYTLFNTSDARSQLTLRGIFTNWGDTVVCNFYSSGEDVLDNAPKEYANDWTSVDMFDMRRYVWCTQEKLKGRLPDKVNLLSHPYWWGAWVSGGLVSGVLPPLQTTLTPYANDWATAFVNEAYPNKDGGWMINERNLVQYYSKSMDWTGTVLKRRMTVAEMLNPVITGEAVWTLTPLFTLPSPLTDINDTTASTYAAASRGRLLAQVFPATTYAMGKNRFGVVGEGIKDWDMNDLVKSLKHGWWTDESPDKWKWTHSDFRDVCLLYTQELYKEMVLQGELK